jgi:hypothetical protein
MKERLINIWFLLLALVVLLLKAIAWLVMAPFILCMRLSEKIRYEAQCLRYPPPPGGLFGAMARNNQRARKERPNPNEAQP